MTLLRTNLIKYLLMFIFCKKQLYIKVNWYYHHIVKNSSLISSFCIMWLVLMYVNVEHLMKGICLDILQKLWLVDKPNIFSLRSYILQWKQSLMVVFFYRLASRLCNFTHLYLNFFNNVTVEPWNVTSDFIPIFTTHTISLLSK